MSWINNFIHKNDRWIHIDRFDHTSDVPILRYDPSSEYVPFYGINKFTYFWSTNYEYSADAKKIELKVQTAEDYFKSILMYWFKDCCVSEKQQVIYYLQKRLQEELDKTFINNFDFYENSYLMPHTLSDVFLNNKYNEETNFSFSGTNYVMRNQFLIDMRKGLILYSLVIKKEYLDFVRCCMILGKEVPLECFELWIRREFIDSIEYKSLITHFRRDVLNHCNEDGIEIKIVNNFDTLFKKFQVPKGKSIKEQKEIIKSLSQEFLNYKRKSLEVPKEEVKKGTGLRNQIIPHDISLTRNMEVSEVYEEEEEITRQDQEAAWQEEREEMARQEDEEARMYHENMIHEQELRREEIS